jgi:hypothetical protein
MELFQETEIAIQGTGIGIERVFGQATMGLKSEPGTRMLIGCGHWAAIPTDRVDDKIGCQVDLLMKIQ